MKDIYVVTHPESVHHLENKVGGWYDTGLTERGRTQAQQIAEKLHDLIGSEKPKTSTSDLKRAHETAKIIVKPWAGETRVDPDLREISYGIAEGQSETWLDEHMSPAPDNNRLDHLNIEGGESKRTFIARIYKAMDRIIADSHPIHIVVTHGFALTFVISRWIDLPVENAGFVNFRTNCGSITHLQQDEYWRNRGVRAVNDISHLAAKAQFSKP